MTFPGGYGMVVRQHDQRYGVWTSVGRRSQGGASVSTIGKTTNNWHWVWRQIAMIDPVPISQTGYSRLKEELERLEKTELPAVMQRVAEAREMGDLKENGEYISGREQQGFIVGRIRELKGMLSRSDIVDCTKAETDHAAFGTIVTLMDLDRNQKVTYQLLGPDEADSDSGSISVQSPIGGAILGHSVGEKFSVTIPRGDRHFEVLDIKRSDVP